MGPAPGYTADGSTNMWTTLGIFAAWIVLQVFVLPRLGVST